MYKRAVHPIVRVLAGIILLQQVPASAATIRVFAAASLVDCLQAIAAKYEGPGPAADKVVFNWAGSSTLARQIEEGAPADIFFSADEQQIDRVAAKGLLASGTRTNLLSNSLVIVVNRESGVEIRSPQDLAGAAVKRIALGDPRVAPIGVYAKKYLEGLGLWEAVRAKVVPTENVRAALAAVESGDADASIVYRTDAEISKRVKVAYAVPPEAGPRIVYVAAVLKAAPEAHAAREFLKYLESENAGAVFRKFGFGTP